MAFKGHLKWQTECNIKENYVTSNIQGQSSNKSAGK
jgi:hypothetical protein